MAVDYTDQGIDPESGLTLKQRLFVDHFLTHLNATKAYRDAGYTATTHVTARVEAHALLIHPDLRDYVSLRMHERAQRLAVTADRVLLELCVVAYARLTDYRINPDTGELEVKPGVPQEALGAVRVVKVTRKT
jgi:phage terminase small subunit